MAKATLLLLFLFFLYPVSLKALPSLSSRIVLGIIGFGIFLIRINKVHHNYKFNISVDLLKILSLLLLIMLISLTSIAYNNTNDLEFVKYPVSIFIGFFSAYLICILLKYTNNNFNQKLLIKYIIYAVALQCILSILISSSSEFKNLVYSILYLEERRYMKIEQFQDSRIIGFGRSFFDAGIYCGMGLILISYLIKYQTLSKGRLFNLLILYLIIFITGMMMARTTLVGTFFSILLLLIPNNYNLSLSKKKAGFLIGLIIVPTVLLLAIYLFIPDIFKSLEYLIHFAFELFFNFFETGKLETTSSNATLRMFKLPEHLKTWIIGDGRWVADNGISYYMFTDIGYMRLLFYFGLLGTGSFFIYQHYIIKLAFDNKVVPFLIFSYFLVLNLKGFSDLSNFMTLLLVFKIMQSKSNLLTSNQIKI